MNYGCEGDNDRLCNRFLFLLLSYPNRAKTSIDKLYKKIISFLSLYTIAVLTSSKQRLQTAVHPIPSPA